jgi:uncharacterized protein (TIGR00255 family)
VEGFTSAFTNCSSWTRNSEERDDEIRIQAKDEERRTTMLRSMTGYSRVQHDESEFTLAVSVKSINHRFLDLQLRLPSGLDTVEPLLRSLVKERISRGHVEVQVSLSSPMQAVLEIDRNLLGAYLKAVQDMRTECGYSSEPDLVALLRIPGVVTTSGGEIPAEVMEKVREALGQSLRVALDRLNEMKTQEGASLERDVRARLNRLAELAAQIAQLAQDAPSFYRRRLDKRVQELLAPGGRTEVDSGRLAQEVAFLASRSDIAEELTRFRSHLDQLDRLLSEGAEVGKKLDFLLQEMNREANTMLSKTTDIPEVGVAITTHAIEMKAEIEKLREQAQNIE